MQIVDLYTSAIDLNELIDKVTGSHQPIMIAGGSVNAILISQDYWNGIQETLDLIKIPGVHESIKQAMTEPLAKSKRVLKF
jgi:PHD/YefM family antitoxin component YafN of YafNO toxin-antitoxin module